MVNNLSNAGDLGRKDRLEKGMATHSSALAWRIPGTEEPGDGVHGATKSHTQLNDSHSHCELIMEPWSLSPFYSEGNQGS